MLCDQWDNLYEGLKDCWPIYRNPEGTPEKNDEYLGDPDYRSYPSRCQSECVVINNRYRPPWEDMIVALCKRAPN